MSTDDTRSPSLSTRERWTLAAQALFVLLLLLALVDGALTWVVGSARLGGALTCGLYTGALGGALARWGAGRSRRAAALEGLVLGAVGAVGWWFWKAG